MINTIYKHHRLFSTHIEVSQKIVKPKSGLQKQVISLYRRLLRVSHDKDRATAKYEDSAFIQALHDSSSSSFAMKEKFRNQSGKLTKRDHARIEHHIRQGEKYIKMLRMGGVKGIGVSSTTAR